MKEKSYEVKLRRMADRQGMKLHGSGAKSPDSIEYKRYWLVSLEDHTVVFGESALKRPSATLEEIEEYLNAWETRR